MTMTFRKYYSRVFSFLIGFFTCLMILSVINGSNYSDREVYPTLTERIPIVEILDTDGGEEIQELQIFSRDEAKQGGNSQQQPAANPIQPKENDTPPKCDQKKHAICVFDTPEDIRTVILPPFLKNYKNPCWAVDPKTEVQPPIRCIPYFFLAGAPKSGTTDLYERIIQHPQISGNLRKENHWFSRFHYIESGSEFPHRPYFRNYTELFLDASTDLHNRVDANGYHDMIFGDSSVSTFWDNTYAINYNEATGKDVAWTPEAIHHLNPKTKFVSIVREPVSRLFSDYLYFDRYQNKSKEDFHRGARAAIDYFKQCIQTHAFRRCISHDRLLVRVWIGIYHGHYEEFFKFFPREQFYIITMEEYSNDMAGKLAEVFSFLELDPVTPEEMSVISDKSKIENTRKQSTFKVGSMLPETKKMLTKFYRQYNTQLGELLGNRFNYNLKNAI